MIIIIFKWEKSLEMIWLQKKTKKKKTWTWHKITQ